MASVDLRRLDDENEEQYIWRLGSAKEAGLLDLSWGELADIINREFRSDETEYRCESAYRKCYQQAKRFYDAGVFKDLTSEAYLKIMQEQKRELSMMKVQIQTEKLEYNRWLREHSRDLLITEKIINSVKELSELQPLDFPSAQPYVGDLEKTAILSFGDTHYGTEFSIKGLHGETIAEYSPEIFEQRMQEILNATIDKATRLGLTKIKVYSLGDEIDGILRASQLMKLRYGVVESTVKYADYICKWLNELTKYLEVEFHMTEGNHSELRMISQPKGTFADDNMSRIIKEFIKVRLAGNPRFEFKENATGLIYDCIYGINILGIHGEVKNMESALKNFSIMYDTPVDIVIGAHKHHFAAETVGVGKDVVNVPSVMGVDGFSMKIEKTADAGALFMIIENHKGVTEQHHIKFN